MKAIQKKVTAERYSPEQRRVLVIADEPYSMFVSSLESAGFKIVGVSTTIAAPVLLSRSRPQLVIANTTMRGLSLEELARILNQGDDDLPFVLVGRDVAALEARRAAMAIGAADYFH